LLASRPATLPASMVPVAVGTAVAHAVGAFQLGPALAALIGALLIQLTTNFANDVFDFEKGADTDERLGPTRAVQAGLLTAAQMRLGMWVSIAAAVAVGVYLVSVAGWPVVAIGVASLASAVLYTAGPAPLGYLGLGDLFVMLFFGFVAVLGTVFVQAHSLHALAWAAAVPVGALCTAILVVNNLRDRHTDVGAGKRTLAVRFGAGFARAEYVVLVASAYVAVLVTVLADLAGPAALLPALTLPLAVGRVREVCRLDGAALNPVLAGTGKLLMLFGLLLSVGIAL